LNQIELGNGKIPSNKSEKGTVLTFDNKTNDDFSSLKNNISIFLVLINSVIGR